MFRSAIPVVFLGFAMQMASDAAACGESLYRVGKGVIYREYTAPLPGKILIVASNEDELALVDILSRSGHEVVAVSTPDQIGEELASEHYDIVMSHYYQHSVVEQETAQGDPSVAYLPVAARDDAAELASAREVNRYALVEDDNIKRFLKAIHKTLKQAQARA